MTSNAPCQGSATPEETVIRPVVPCYQNETTTTSLQSFLLDHPNSVGSDAKLQERQDSARSVVARVDQLFPSRDSGDGDDARNETPPEPSPTDLAGVGGQFSNN